MLVQIIEALLGGKQKGRAPQQPPQTRRFSRESLETFLRSSGWSEERIEAEMRRLGHRGTI